MLDDFFGDLRPTRMGTPITLPDPGQARSWLPRERFPYLVDYFLDCGGQTFHLADAQGNLHLLFRVEQQEYQAVWDASAWALEWERSGVHRFTVTLVIYDRVDDPMRVPFIFALEHADQAHDAARLVEQRDLPIYLLVAIDGHLALFDRRLIQLPDEFRHSLGQALQQDFRSMAATAQGPGTTDTGPVSAREGETGPHSAAAAHENTSDPLAAGVGVLMRHTHVSREQVESDDLSPVLALIRAREEEARSRHPLAQTLAFSIGGYDEDPRELFQIPEVRQWFAALDEAVPHLLYFLSPHAGLPLVYAACLLTPEWDGGTGKIAFDQNESLRFLGAKLSAIGYYCREHGLDPTPVASMISATYGMEVDAENFYHTLAEELDRQVNGEAAKLEQYTRLAERADSDTRMLLGLALGGAPEAAQHVVEALKRASWETAEILAEAIPWFGPAAIPHLRKTAYGKKKSAIYCSLRALSGIGGPDALDVLCQRFEDLPTKGEAIEGLIDLGAPAIPRIIDYTMNGQAEIRRLAAYALGKMGVSEASELLQAMATGDRSSAVRDMATIALAWLGGEPCEVSLRGLMPVIELRRDAD